MKVCRNTCWVILLIFFGGCSLDEADQESMLIFSRDFNFEEGLHDWTPGFADYPAGADDSTFYELRYAYTDQPLTGQVAKKSVMLSGNNHNQDLFMYLKRRISALKPDTEYTITFNVELAAYVSADKASQGSVYLKAGASSEEPKNVVVSGHYRMNINKGNHGDTGAEMISLGNLSTPESGTGYTLFMRNNIMANSRYVMKTNSLGELWLIVGTESNIKSTTAVYYSRVNVVFSAS